jgi:hypothetical protein
MSGTELEYCMMRARQEAHRALACNEPEAASAHQQLSVRYSARAFMLHRDNDEREDQRLNVVLAAS